MKIEKNILDLIKRENPEIEIAGLRGLVKSGENEWSFRYTYRDGDFLSVSKIIKIKFEGIKKNPIIVSEKKSSNKKEGLKKTNQENGTNK